MMRNLANCFVRCPIGILLLAAAGCGAPTPPPAVFLGHVAILSGPEGKAGKSAEQGMRMALEELGPAAGEALGGKPLVVRHVDAASNSSNVLDNIEGQAARLVSINKAIGLLGGLTKDDALRLDRSRVPVLAATGMRTSAMSELLFTTGLPPSTQGRLLAQFLVEQSGTGGTLIVDARREEGLLVAENFRRGWIEAWSKRDDKTEPPRWTELTLPEKVKHADWAGVVLKDQPKSIVFAGAAADFEALRQAWGSAAPRLVFAGDDGSWQPQTSVAGKPVIAATAFALAKDNAKAHEFAKKYRAATGEDPDVHAAIAHDNVRLFAEALKKGVPDKAEKLAEELAKIQDLTGLTGPLSFKGERQLRRPAFIVAIDGSTRAPATLKKFDP